MFGFLSFAFLVFADKKDTTLSGHHDNIIVDTDIQNIFIKLPHMIGILERTRTTTFYEDR